MCRFSSQKSSHLSLSLGRPKIGKLSQETKVSCTSSAVHSLGASTYAETATGSHAHVAEEKIGVLLLNLGGPDTLHDVQPFLFNLFADPVSWQLYGTFKL